MFVLCASQRKVKVERPDTLVSDSVNVYPVKFNFTPEWKELSRTAVFRTVYNRKVEQTFELLLDETNVCNIPWELLLKHGRILQAGVYGTQGDNLILNTIWTPLGEIYEGAKNIDESDNHPEEPTPDVYQQILSQMGNLDELETEDKSSLVNAINEVYKSIGSGVGPDGPLPAGVSSFNNRTGIVMPMAGDYTAEMVGATPAENFDKLSADFENYKLQNELDLSSKLDTTGGTVTGSIMFSEDASTLSDEDVPASTNKGVVVSSEGFYKDSDGPLNIYTNSGEVNFSANTTLTNVVGDDTIPNSVPNMEQLKDSVDSIKAKIPTKTSQIENDSGYITDEDIPEIPTKVSQLENDSNFATEKYVQDAISDIDIGADGMISDHRLLTNRDSDNQHPISSITGLQDVLDNIPIAMTADQLRKILMNGEI